LAGAIRKAAEEAQSHWIEGAVIGGVLGAAAGLALLSLGDEGQYSTGQWVGGTLLMAFPGAVVGALIGGSVPKDRDSP
jgi:hypothetical protein